MIPVCALCSTVSTRHVCPFDMEPPPVSVSVPCRIRPGRRGLARRVITVSMMCDPTHMWSRVLHDHMSACHTCTLWATGDRPIYWHHNSTHHLRPMTQPPHRPIHTRSTDRGWTYIQCTAIDNPLTLQLFFVCEPSFLYFSISRVLEFCIHVDTWSHVSFFSGHDVIDTANTTSSICVR